MTEMTRAKINLKDGLIELEGSEEFVQKNLDGFKEKVNFSANSVPRDLPQNSSQVAKKQKVVQQKTRTFQKNPDPISFEVRGNSSEGIPSLQEFITQKKPKSAREILICVGFYLKKYLNLKEFKEGHVVYAFLHIKVRRPTAFHQLFLDTKNDNKWIISGSDGVDSWQLFSLGEDYVNYDLPKKEDEKERDN